MSRKIECDRRAFGAMVLTTGLTSFLPGQAASASEARIDVTEFGVHADKDCRPAILAALDVLRRAGGGTLVLPPIGGYQISDTVEIDFSSCRIELHDDVRLTNINKSSAFIFKGNIFRPLQDVSIVGMGSIRRIDGNGRNIIGYSYATNDTLYSCVIFMSCERWVISNIHAYNGLVNCIRALQCGVGKNMDCDASYSEYDNGHSVDFDPSWRNWGINDPSSWSRAQILRCRAWRCSGLGITSYAASKVSIIDAEVWECGNDTTAQPNNGGGISVEGNVGNSSISDTRNYGGRIIGAKVRDCWNQGLHISAAGTSLHSSDIRNTRAPRHRPNKAGLYGSNILMFSAASLSVIATTLSSAERHGIGIAAAVGEFPTLEFSGKIISSGSCGIMCYGVEKIKISKGSKILNSGATINDCGVLVLKSNSYPRSNGIADIQGYISGSSGYAINLSDILYANIHEISLNDNCFTQNCSQMPIKLVRVNSVAASQVIINGRDDFAVVLRGMGQSNDLGRSKK